MTKLIVTLVILVALVISCKPKQQLFEEGLPVIPLSQVYDEATSEIYELIFCNLSREQTEELLPKMTSEDIYKKELLQIANNKNEDSRTRFLAWQRLKDLQILPNEKEILGVIVEYHNKNGLDTLALYQDGSVRYINYTGGMTFIDEPLIQLEQLTKDTMNNAKQLAQAIGPWEKKRLPPPAKGNIRITLLVNGDFYMKQGTIEDISTDNIISPTYQNMTMLLSKIVEFVSKKNEKNK